MEIIHGGDRYGAAAASKKREDELLDFSANINPLGLLPGIREALCREMDSVLHYPDPLCRRLRQAISEAEEVPGEQILCGGGGADLIYRLVYAKRPKKAMVTAPAFAEYEEALNQTGTKIRYYQMKEDLRIREDMKEWITGDLDLMFVCNPNNPTGILTGRELLLGLVEQAAKAGTTVLVDECFLDFVEEPEAYTLKAYLESFPNLVILKSFTKLYAVPGLRLGYVLSADTGLLEAMGRAGQPWGVGSLAEAAGIAALKEKGFREQTAGLVARERRQLKAGLEEMGLSVYDGAANYLCFLAKGEEKLAQKLLEQGILIRRCQNYRGLTAEHYRVAVRSFKENETLLGAMSRVLERG